MIATPIPAGAKDLEGYQKLLEPRNSEYLWSKAGLRSMGLRDTTVNPYELHDDHAGTQLRFTLKAVQKVISNEPDRGVQGSRLRKIWKECLIRRTHASRIPFDAEDTIASKLPALHPVVIVCPLPEEEQAAYNSFEESVRKKLIVKDEKTQKPRFNNGILRQLILQAAWVHFEPIHEDIMAETFRTHVLDPHFIWRWFKKVQRHVIPFDVPDKEDKPALLATMLKGAPKLRPLMRNIGETTCPNKQKAIIWTLFPATQLQMIGALQLAGISVGYIHSEMTMEERDQVRDAFNNDPDSCMVLILTYGLGMFGLNLQKCSPVVELYDPALSEAEREQAIGRAHRFANFAPFCKVGEYFVPRTFCDRLLTLNIRKALPNMFAQFNAGVFDLSQDAETSYEAAFMGDWVEKGGELFKATDPEVEGLARPILPPVAIMELIYSNMHGKKIKVVPW